MPDPCIPVPYDLKSDLGSGNVTAIRKWSSKLHRILLMLDDVERDTNRGNRRILC
jgi:hypothetical protein